MKANLSFIPIFFLVFQFCLSMHTYAQDLLGFHPFISTSPYSKLSEWSIAKRKKGSWLQMLFMPFTFPAESKLHPEWQEQEYVFQKEQDRYQVQESRRYRLSIFSRNSRLASDYMSFLQTTIPSDYSATFMYQENRLQLDFGLLVHMSTGKEFDSPAQHLRSRITIAYRLANDILKYRENLSLDAILQLSETQARFINQRYKRKISVAEPIRLRAIAPGIRLRAKSFMFEGMIQMPIQNLSPSEADFNPTLTAQELRGSLGMKWYLPEYIEP
ncbi:MAG: hypothetical protein AAF518_01935 [Spirochaetota bacterium]